MTNYHLLNKSISNFLWAYAFILFNISIGPVDVLPDFIGYILMAIGIFTLSEELEHSNVMKFFAIAMSAWSVFKWICNLFSVSSDILTFVSSSAGAVDIILNFLLLTDLSILCIKYQSDKQTLDKKLITARNIYICCSGASILSAMLLLFISKTEGILIGITAVISLACIVLFIIVMILLFQGLSGLKKITANLEKKFPELLRTLQSGEQRINGSGKFQSP